MAINTTEPNWGIPECPLGMVAHLLQQYGLFTRPFEFKKQGIDVTSTDSTVTACHLLQSFAVWFKILCRGTPARHHIPGLSTHMR